MVWKCIGFVISGKPLKQHCKEADFYLLRIIGKTMVIPEDHPWIDCYGQMPPETTPKMRYFAAEAAQAASQKVQ